MTPIKTFDIKEFVRKQKEEQFKNVSDSTSSSNGGGFPFPGMPGMPGMNPTPNSDFDIDKMIKEIDAKIAELEKEEEEEKKKAMNSSASSTDIDSDHTEKPKIGDNEPIINRGPKISEESKEVPNDNNISNVSQVKKEKEELPFTSEVINVNKEPRIDEIVHSNMVDLENFKLKNDNNVSNNNEEIKEEPKETFVDKKQEDKILSDDNDFDDFFDDFFFEE